MVDETHIKNVMQAYAEAVSGDDVEAILALFTEDAVVEDPVDSEPHRGQEALRAFYQGAIEAVDKMTLDGSVRARGNKGAAAMLAYPKGAGGSVVIETLDVMAFNDDGKITSMTAYWGDNNIRSL